MHSIRTKITLTVVSVIILTVCIVAAIGVISIKKLGSDDADQMIHLTATTGAMNLEQYSYEGVQKEAVWISLSNGMRLYVCAPVPEINSGWTGMIRNILVALFIILAISIIGMMRFTGCLTKPLGDLTAAAKQADEGNYEFSLEYDKDDEIGILTHTFKQLAANTKEKITKARTMTDIDPLTGIKNKHAYAQWEENINGRIKEGDQNPFAVVVCDINNLKIVNDMYGHNEGDACIKNACARICGVFSHSPVFRIGGDEFVVILSGED